MPSLTVSHVEPPFVLRWMRAKTVPAAEPPCPSCRPRAQIFAEPTPAGRVAMLLVGLKAFSVSMASACQTTREDDSACDEEPIEGQRFGEQHFYRKTALFDRFLAFDVRTEAQVAIRH
ncbi:hypothetical protein [Roseomonas sp. AR75]|uniref:hypothetical protein n=1 Tax=Roseomonas sp. AR75 TaxID=2562311 RepID=UPI0010C041BC|nr:hypothetical protein [Roseomonas sp. AR75]